VLLVEPQHVYVPSFIQVNEDANEQVRCYPCYFS